VSTLTIESPVRRRKVVDGGDFITVHLWREDCVSNLPADLEQALLEAEREASSSEEAKRNWEADLASLRSLVGRLEAAIGRLQHTLRHGPLWAAAAAAFALQRVQQDLASARDSLSWASQEAQEAARRALDARRALREIRNRAAAAARTRWARGRTYTVRLRRANGDLVPVSADRPDAVPAAVEAARAWLRARARPTVDPEVARWALDQELRRAAEAQQPQHPLGHVGLVGLPEGQEGVQQDDQGVAARRLLLPLFLLRQLEQLVLDLRAQATQALPDALQVSQASHPPRAAASGAAAPRRRGSPPRAGGSGRCRPSRSAAAPGPRGLCRTRPAAPPRRR